jgi:Putative beta-barrel porin 2
MLTVNHRSSRKVRQSASPGLLVSSVLGALALPLAAHAQLAGKASATAQYENNSNPFALDSSVTAPGTSGLRGSSTDFQYGAEFDGTYDWSRQQFYAKASARQYDFQHFSQLNHNEYAFDTGLNWKLADLLDGNVEVVRSHVMVPLLDLSGTAAGLSLLTEQREAFDIGLKLDSDWRLEGSAYSSRTSQPVPGVSDLILTQNSGSAALRYAGIGPLTAGITAGYLSGDYGGTGAGANSSYSQSMAGFVANYKLKRTSFDGQVTYTRRTSLAGRDNASGLTGLLDFKDQLTPKTSFAVKVERVINTYFLNLGSEIDSDAGVSVNWQATYKVAVSLGYTFTYRQFPGQTLGPGRYPNDYQQYGNLGIIYAPVRWLQIGPYANVQTRRSNVLGRDFNATVYGVTLTATVGDTPAAVR